MNVFQKAVSNIKSGFASYTEVTNAASVEQNPMLKALLRRGRDAARGRRAVWTGKRTRGAEYEATHSRKDA